jgi:acetolactate synthase I/II/III large subunit
MSKRRSDSVLSRRGLIKGATLAGAAAVGNPLSGRAQETPTLSRPSGPVTPAPNPAMEPGHPPDRPIIQGTSGSDYMADVIKSLGIEHVACNPGTSFRGLHESLINYLKIDWHTCTHEEASVAMANGHAKIEGKPLLVLAHGTVGLQHASMALYNAWCDRVPIYMMVGNTVDATKRAPGGEWFHSVQDAAALVRDFVKWDDLPGSLTHFGESAVRAYQIAMTPPMAPVLMVLDSELQDGPIPPHEKLVVPKLPKIAPLIGDPGGIAEAAQLLVNATNPVIVADRFARSQAGIDRLVELAEILQCAVVDLGGRMNFPRRHGLNKATAPGRWWGRPTSSSVSSWRISGARPMPSTTISSAMPTPSSGPAPSSWASAPHPSTSRRTTRTSSATRKSISPSRQTPRRPCLT